MIGKIVSYIPFVIIAASFLILVATFYYVYAPTIRNYLILDKILYEKKRENFKRLIYDTIQNKSGYKVVFLKKNSFEDSSYIEVRDCLPVPLTSRIHSDNPVRIRNSSNATILLEMLGKTYSIPAWNSRAFQISFPVIPALFSYTCNNSANASGFLYVTK